MKKVFFVTMAALVSVLSCMKEGQVVSVKGDDPASEGRVSVKLDFESAVSKSANDYVLMLDEELLIKNVEVLVFSNETSHLERSVSLNSINDECSFSLPVGNKLVYALVNGPETGGVRTRIDLLNLVDDLTDAGYEQDGFMMIGSEWCRVQSGAVAEPVISVSRMVSRIVLRSVKCNVPTQYQDMTVDCVFLGNAFMKQTVEGDMMEMVNVDGYMDEAKLQPIGLDGVKGNYPDYLFRNLGYGLSVGQTNDEPVCLYCQPNVSDKFTCLYMLVTIGGNKYYYRVPLDKKLFPNATCTVDVVITNLGASLPPDGDIQKGEIVANVAIADWAAGGLYDAEF